MAAAASVPTAAATASVPAAALSQSDSAPPKSHQASHKHDRQRPVGRLILHGITHLLIGADG
jgi:hypothetical protein